MSNRKATRIPRAAIVPGVENPKVSSVESVNLERKANELPENGAGLENERNHWPI